MNISDVRIWTALITPFTNEGSIDTEAFDRLITSQVEAGIKGLLLFGTTGEAPTLTDDEMKELSRRTMVMKKDALIMVGVSHNNTAVALEKIKKAEKWGANVLLAAPPYYNRPNPEGLRRHFKALASSTKLPIVLYNIPFRVGVNMELDLIRELAELDNVVGIKEASSNVAMASQLYGDGKLAVWSGDDSLLLPYMSVGGLGGISVSSNMFPKEFLSIAEAFVSGNLKKAADLSAKFASFYPVVFAESNPTGIKCAMASRGLIQNELRMPMCPMTEQNATHLRKFLSSGALSCVEEA